MAVTLADRNDDKHSKLANNIVSGGPPPDGIPPIENPDYISVEEADEFLNNEDVVFVLETDDQIFVYLQRIMVWHEIVNKEIVVVVDHKLMNNLFASNHLFFHKIFYPEPFFPREP